MALDFTSAPQEQQDAPTEIEFTLDKKPFKVVMRTDADSVLEWSELAASATAEDIESAAGVAFTARFFKLVMPPDQYAALRAHLKEHHTPAETLVSIMQAVNEEMEQEVTEATARPTKPSSSSSRGRGARAGRTSKIISLAAIDGEIEYVDEPSPRPARKQPQRRRRAG